MRSSLKTQKIEITQYIAIQEGLPSDEQNLRKLLSVIWQNPRPKAKGGLKLTEKGFELLSLHFKAHQVRFEETLSNPKFTNQMILRLDNFITCPWFMTHKGMWVFDDKMAIQLVLFSGDITKFTTAKARSLDRSH